MPTRQTSFLSEILEGSPIPLEKRAYFQERLRNRLYDLVVTKFVDISEKEGLTQRELAHRIGNRPDRLNRLLASPGNWTIDTLSDLILGIAGAELEVSIVPLSDRPKRNSRGPEWLKSQEHPTLGEITRANSPTSNTVEPVVAPIGNISPIVAYTVGAL